MTEVSFADNTLTLKGELTNQTTHLIYAEARRLIKTSKPTSIDLSAVTVMDSTGVALLDDLQSLASGKGSLVIVNGANEDLTAIIETFSSLALTPQEKVRKVSYFEQAGETGISAWQNLIIMLTLASESFYWALVGLFDHSSARKGSFYAQAFQLGTSALPIVALLSLVIGFILSLQSGVQLRNYGAGVFLADLISITMVREMGPLVTAIIVAGRSGSAIASEIATMKVTEELDALQVMALNPLRFVIVPKIHAITVVMPMLVAFSIIVGIMGGVLISVGYLNLSLSTFISRAVDIIIMKDLVVTFIKSIAFAWVIVIIGSFYGFQVRGGAEGVGKATTMSVVNSIFAVILLDAVFSLLYL